MKRAITLPALVTAFVALSPVGVAVATPSPAPMAPVINVDNPGSAMFCNADDSSCWIERGGCADSRPDSQTMMTDQCGTPPSP